MSEPSSSVFPCSPSEWTVIPVPDPSNDDGKNFATAEHKLRAAHPDGKAWRAVCRARGDGNLAVDLNGIHWPHPDAKLELQVALLDGSQVKAQAPFPKGGADRLP